MFELDLTDYDKAKVIETLEKLRNVIENLTNIDTKINGKKAAKQLKGKSL